MRMIILVRKPCPYSRFKVSVSGGEKLLPAENNNLKDNQSPNLKSRVCVQSDHLERMIPTSKRIKGRCASKI